MTRPRQPHHIKAGDDTAEAQAPSIPQPLRVAGWSSDAPMLAAAREECRKRSLRLGTNERPGGLPQSEKYEQARVLAERRRASIIANITAGNDDRPKLRAALHFASWADQTVEALVAAGQITAVRRGNSVTYRVVA